MIEVNPHEVIAVLDSLRVAPGHTGKGGCWCYASDHGRPSFTEHTSPCKRVSEFYLRLNGIEPETEAEPEDEPDAGETETEAAGEA